MSDLDKFMASEFEFDLNSDDISTRRHALMSLCGSLGNQSARELVEKVAIEDPSEELRYIARKNLDEFLQSSGVLGKVSTIKDIDASKLEEILQSGTREQKLATISALISHKKSEFLSQILASLDSEKDNWVIASLVKASGILGDAQVIPRIQAYLNHKDPRIQANTIEAMEAVEDDIVFPLIVPMLGSKDNRVRANAIKALISYDREQAVSTLKSMGLSDKEWQRDSALYCLSIIDTPDVVTIVMKMFEQEFRPELQKKAAKIIGEKGGAELLKALGVIAASEHRSRAVLARYCVEEITKRHPNAKAEADDSDEQMSRDEAVSRVNRLMKTSEQPAAARSIDYTTWATVAAVVVIVFMGAWAVSGSGDSIPGSSSIVPKVVRGPLRNSPDHRGEFVALSGIVRAISVKDKNILVGGRNRLVLFGCDDLETLKKLKVGSKVRAEGKVTGKTRFGALYAKASDCQLL